VTEASFVRIGDEAGDSCTSTAGEGERKGDGEGVALYTVLATGAFFFVVMPAVEGFEGYFL
jgi:hypothetical protein